MIQKFLSIYSKLGKKLNHIYFLNNGGSYNMKNNNLYEIFYSIFTRLYICKSNTDVIRRNHGFRCNKKKMG